MANLSIDLYFSRYLLLLLSRNEAKPYSLLCKHDHTKPRTTENRNQWTKLVPDEGCENCGIIRINYIIPRISSLKQSRFPLRWINLLLFQALTSFLQTNLVARPAVLSSALRMSSSDQNIKEGEVRCFICSKYFHVPLLVSEDLRRE